MLYCVIVEENIAKKNILITGASSGLGALLKKRFEADGASVFALSRSGEFPCDVRDEEQVASAVAAAAAAQCGAFDMIICNAGAGISGAVEHLPTDAVRDNVDVNFFGAYYLIKHGLSYLKEGGRVVSVSSAAALFPVPYREIYSAGKAALNMLTLGLGLETEAFRTITICPGEIATPFTVNRAVYDGTDEKYGDRPKAAAEKVKRGKKRMDADKAADKLYRIMNKKRPKRFYIVGAKVKAFYFFSKILPTNLFLKLIGATHGGRKHTEEAKGKEEKKD